MLRLQDAWWPLALATMAGLSTSVGAVIAVVRKPSARMMAALLGVALGVMATVSLLELLLRNALAADADALLVVAACTAGALAYYIAEPFFPKMDDTHVKKQEDLDDHEAFFRALHAGQPTAPADGERSAHGAQRKLVGAAGGHAAAAASGLGLTRKSSGALDAAAPEYGGGAGGGAASSGGVAAADFPAHGGGPGGGGGAPAVPLPGSGSLHRAASGAGEGLMALVMGSGAGAGAGGDGPGGAGGGTPAQQAAARLSAGRMLRLGLLMAVTMTLHNLPEGFAVAFSAFTDFGPVMAAAIALHNIPETRLLRLLGHSRFPQGVIVAAPIYAATGSRWRAVGIATASGLSEPLGALLALLLLQPFFTPERLHYLLAFVGGVMLAVCVIELWPEGRRCRHDRAFAAGVAGGSAVMAWTLYVQG